MELTASALNLDWAETEARIEGFIGDYVQKSKASGIIVSLSGGLDSCTVAALSSLAVGGDRVLGLQLPEEETYNAEDIRHSGLVAKKFGFKTKIVDITPTLRAFYKMMPGFDLADKVCRGNIKARLRMTCVYYHANKANLIVCGSSDKSEAMMGYFTKWGDVAADLSPIMDLYKTQVRKLANHMEIPKAVTAKPSTPSLWPGQLAENELGMKYERLDLILYGLEHFMRTDEIAHQLHLGRRLVDKVKQRWLQMEHKRRPLLTAKLEYRTVGADFRLPRGS